MAREKIKTMAGMSVRAELDLRLAEARTAAIKEVIVFLGSHGHLVAAEDLQKAAFTDLPPVTPAEVK